MASTLAQFGHGYAGADEAISSRAGKPYVFKDLDLIKTEKIIKCEITNKGA